MNMASAPPAAISAGFVKKPAVHPWLFEKSRVLQQEARNELLSLSSNPIQVHYKKQRSSLRRRTLSFFYALSLQPLQQGPAVEHRLCPQLCLDAQQLIVFGYPFRAIWRSGLDLSGIEGHHEIGNRGILRLA